MAFPLNPSNNQVANRFGRQYKYVAAKGRWDPINTAALAEIANISVNTLSDIDIATTAPQDGETLVWNAAQSKFVPGAASGSGTTVYATFDDLPLSGIDPGAQAFISENNRLYLWNGSGWYNIALINTAPTITQGAAASYSKGILSSDTVITLTATDPEGFPLTYSYSITSGSLQDTTVTQANNVFTISPGATATTFNISFTASDGINISTSSSAFTIVNNPPVFTTSPESTYALASDGTPTVITLAATDPENQPITWSYSVTSGSLGNTTVTQSDNIFTITPSTNGADAGVFGITFTASDGTNSIAAASTFTLVLGLADAYYNLNSTVIKTGSTAGLNNTTIIDESTNGFTVTRSGDVYQGSYSPYSPAGWSGYFNGSSKLVVGTNSNISIATNQDFTLEFWVKLEGAQKTTCIFDWGIHNQADEISMFCQGSGGWIIGNQLQTTYATPAALLWDNEWHHVAISRNSNVAKIYIDGTLNFTNSNYPDAVATALPELQLGALKGYGGYEMNGYLSNFRIVKGTGLYPSDFTPPTERLTAIPGTAVLTLQDSWFKDNSANNFAITRVGDAKSVPNSPYLPSQQYNPAVHGGSMYFDGTGDYLDIPGDAAAFGTSDYTVEGWHYYTGAAATNTRFLIDCRFGGSASLLLFFENAIYKLYVNGGHVANGGTLVKDAWQHFALVRSSGSTKLYVNGTSVFTWADSTNYVSTQIRLGRDVNNNDTLSWVGYMSDIRIVKGTAVYTSDFTPPTQPLTAISGTSLLIRGANAGVYDEMGKNNLSLIGNATTNTTVTKYNTTSMYFNGTGDYVRILDNPLFNFGSNDFTVECWFYGLGSNSTNGSTLVGKSNISSFGPINLSFHPTTKYLQANFSTSGSAWAFNITTNLTYDSLKNAWHHVALTRSGSSFNLYLDGINVGTVTNSSALVNNAEAFMVGYLNYTNTFWNGYIEDVRITKGYARYTANFTPPTEALGFYNAE